MKQPKTETLSLASMKSKSRINEEFTLFTNQKEEIYDNAIKCMTESPEKEREEKYTDLAGLFKKPRDYIIEVLRK